MKMKSVVEIYEEAGRYRRNHRSDKRRDWDRNYEELSRVE